MIIINQYNYNKELKCYEMELHDRNLNHLGFAIIDEEDYIKVKDYNWTIDKEGFIVGRKRGGGKQIRMGRCVLNMGDCRIRIKYRKWFYCTNSFNLLSWI